MATVATSGDGNAPSVPKNNGGTIVKAGNADTTNGPITKNVGLNDLADDYGEAIGSKIVAQDGTTAATTDRVGVAKIVSGGTLAYYPSHTGVRSESFIIQGVSTKIGGVANTFLSGPGTDYNGAAALRTSIHQVSGTNRYGVGTFNVYARPSTNITPNYTKGAGAGNAYIFVAPSGDGNGDGSDDAANPTRAVPGELTYHFGALAAPTTDEYKARDSYES